MGSPHPFCAGCPIERSAEGFCPPQNPQPHTRLVVWGEAPGATEVQTGYGFTGAAGKLLREWLRRGGLSVASAWPDDLPARGKNEDVAFRNVVLCKRPQNRFPSVDEVSACWSRHQQHFRTELPQVAMGANAVRWLTGQEVQLTKARGSVLPVREELGGGYVVAALHPAFLVRGGGLDNPGEEQGKSADHLKPTLAVDARRALERCSPNVPNVAWMERPTGMVCPRGSLVSVDIEGADGQPNIVGVCWEKGHGYVFPWSDELRGWLNNLFATCLPTFHNAAYDIPELRLAGVEPPKVWLDTINMAALYDPSQPMNLQWQVLTHVPGSTTWKGLVDHEKGPNYAKGTVADARGLWADILSRLGRPVPATGTQWYAFYNCLDTAWAYELTTNLRDKLQAQGRWNYYLNILQPLQPLILDMSGRGVPVDPSRLARHKEACQRLQRMAYRGLKSAGDLMLEENWKNLQKIVDQIQAQKVLAMGVLKGKVKWPHDDRLSKAKLAARYAKKAWEKGFNTGSSKQRSLLLYDYLKVPRSKVGKSGQGSTDDETLTFLQSQLKRGTVKVKNKEEVLRAVASLLAANKWALWERNFLNPNLVYPSGGVGLRPRVVTSFALHKTDTGRLSSGVDNSDLDKGTRKKVQQLQNVPKRLRDIYRADPGYCFVGADYSAIEWCVALWFADKLANPYGYHKKLFDAFQRGELDPHRLLASKIEGVPLEDVTGAMRTAAKAITFGYLFGGSSVGLAQRIQRPHDFVEKATKAHDGVFQFLTWRKHTVARTAKQHKVETPLGWRRYFWDWYPKATEVLATEIQATAADLLKWSLVRLGKALEEHPKWELLLTVHDHNMLHVPVEDGQLARDVLVEAMCGEVPWLSGWRFKVEAKIGDDWSKV